LAELTLTGVKYLLGTAKQCDKYYFQEKIKKRIIFVCFTVIELIHSSYGYCLAILELALNIKRQKTKGTQLRAANPKTIGALSTKPAFAFFPQAGR